MELKDYLFEGKFPKDYLKLYRNLLFRQDNLDFINPHLFNVIEPVSITPTVDNIAIATLAHLEPRSWRRRLFSLEAPMKIN